MSDQLARLRPARCQVQAVDDVIEPPFEQLQEDLTCLPRHALGLAEVVLELRLEHAVVLAHLLLFAQLAAVLRDLLAAFGILRFLAGRRAAPFDGALLGQAALAFEEEFDFFTGFAGRRLATADAANGCGITCHYCFLTPVTPGAVSAAGSHCAESV